MTAIDSKGRTSQSTVVLQGTVGEQRFIGFSSRWRLVSGSRSGPQYWLDSIHRSPCDGRRRDQLARLGRGGTRKPRGPGGRAALATTGRARPSGPRAVGPRISRQRLLSRVRGHRSAIIASGSSRRLVPARPHSSSRLASAAPTGGPRRPCRRGYPGPKGDRARSRTRCTKACGTSVTGARLLRPGGLRSGFASCARQFGGQDESQVPAQFHCRSVRPDGSSGADGSRDCSQESGGSLLGGWAAAMSRSAAIATWPRRLRGRRSKPLPSSRYWRETPSGRQRLTVADV